MPHDHRRLPVRRVGFRLLGGAGRHHRAQRAHRLGVHQPHHRRDRPLPREDRGRRSTGATAQLVPLEERTETIKVAGGDDVELASARRCTARSSRGSPTTSPRSPTIRTPARTAAVIAPGGAPEGEYAVSLRWTALEPGTTARAIFALNIAQDFDDFRDAAALFDVPAQNLIYADRRRQHRLPDARTTADPRRGRRVAAAAGLGLGVRLAGLHPVRRAAHVVQPARGLHRHGEQRHRVRGLPVFAHARLGLRLARGAHRGSDRAQGGDGPAHRRRHARHPGRQRVRDGQAPRGGLHRHLDGSPRAGCRPRAAAFMGRAERRRLGCRCLRERAVGRTRHEPVRERPSRARLR